mmetsp:Transcript_3824/g.10041  ORF Transcript_3824/g.10041 Transcript_3824/m.10041 type:complete len:184 (+) Transcript_3824:258-809(+)|eukprot:CAMPEP_0197180108 /NCGR_PEP_ID=MMETSP1423-20130617/4831_1 /TAXON_ID=476441 /ORGANISM="Pseudo-nitzschia heimii, Strain UNC1101" /LENGTH=183 /DNA_ID=CAMNT_0042630129 /DNA_START=242 /DNA_END=793 /DNA_ORIENTATION=-
MSNNSNGRSLLERRDLRGETHKTNQMKDGEMSNSDKDGSEREDTVMPQEKLLDPVEEARKALEIFQEVSGEAIAHMIPKKGVPIKAESNESNDEHRYLGRDRNSREIRTPLKNANEKMSRNFSQKRKLESDSKAAAESDLRKRDNAGEAEEEARQKKRIEDGEARRREFRPKIARLQDSNCLL